MNIYDTYKVTFEKIYKDLESGRDLTEIFFDYSHIMILENIGPLEFIGQIKNYIYGKTARVEQSRR